MADNDTREPRFELLDNIFPDVLMLSDLLSSARNEIDWDTVGWAGFRIHNLMLRAKRLLEGETDDDLPNHNEPDIHALYDAIEEFKDMLDCYDLDAALRKMDPTGVERLRGLTKTVRQLGAQLESVPGEVA